jgi:hypothetical protein
MPYPVTAEGVRDFIDYLSNKGLLNANSANGLRTACEKIFSALDIDERNNLNGLDVDAAIARFMNKNPGGLTPQSASAYRSRVRKALDLLNDFNSNPAGFRIQPLRKSSNNGDDEKRTRLKKTTSEQKKSPRPTTSNLNESNYLEPEHAKIGAAVNLSFPLRNDFVAQFIVPKDLTIKEAKRLGAYFEVIAVDFDPG